MKTGSLAIVCYLYALLFGASTGLAETEPAPRNIKWHAASVPMCLARFQTLAEGSGRFVLGGSLGWTLVSEDGANWRGNRYLAPGDPGTNIFQTIVFGAGRFVGLIRLISSSPDSNRVLVSEDGLKWDLAPDAPALCSTLYFLRGKFIGFDATNAYTSADGIGWERKALVPPLSFGGDSAVRRCVIAPYGDGFVGIGRNFFVADKDFNTVTTISPAPCMPGSMVSDGQQVFADGRWYRTGGGRPYLSGTTGTYRLVEGTNWVATPVAMAGSSLSLRLAWGNGVFLGMASYAASYLLLYEGFSMLWSESTLAGAGKHWYLDGRDGPTTWPDLYLPIVPVDVLFARNRFWTFGDNGLVFFSQEIPPAAVGARLSAKASVSGSNFSFGVESATDFSLESSADLLQWSPWSDLTRTDQQFTDPSSGNTPHRFFRARSQ